jgi:carboxymethylenebutenolidase
MSLAAVFALAVSPVSAETVTTDASGLTAGEVKIPVADGSIPGYRAMPDGSGPFPVIMVVHEIFGVHEHIRDICRRLAQTWLLRGGAGAICPRGRCRPPERQQ